MSEEVIYLRTDEDIKKLREIYLKKLSKPKLTSERARIITEAYKETGGEPMMIRRGKALKKILSEMTIYIKPWDLIVGNLGPEPVSIPVYPEGGVDYILEELDTYDKREYDTLTVPEDVKRELRSILPWWYGKTLKDRALSITPKETKEANDAGLFTYENMLAGGVGHFIPNYEKILKWGLEGIEEYIKKRMESLDLTKPENYQKHIFYKACLIVIDGVKTYAKRYAELAKKLAEEEKDPQRKEELLQIAKVCEHVPMKPARTFWEALQAVWFTHVICYIDSNGYAVTLGRLDQLLYPYYKKDIEEGRLTKEEAKRLLTSFWFKCSDILKLYSNKAAQVYAGFPVSQPPELGGLTPDGEDATNELSELMLEVEEKVALPQPDIALLWTEKMKDDFLVKAAKVITKTNKPKIFNTHIGIQAMINAGVPMEEARKNWAFVGCVENSISGKTWGWHNSGYYSVAKAFELALNNGVDPRTGKRLGPETGDPTKFKSFDEVVNAVKKQIAHTIKLLVQGVHAVEMAHRELWPEIWESILVDDCVEKGVDLHHSGARYNFNEIEAVGFATLVDSLMAIKKFVFEKKEITMEELLQALRTNFEGAEALRQKLMNETPKYGNDIDEVDQLAVEMFTFICNEVQKYRNARGGTFIAGFYTNGAQTYFGQFVGTTPDGRKAGEPLSDAISPAHGADKRGPTAVMRSVAKLPHAMAWGGTLLNMKFHIHSLTGEEKIRKFAQLIKTYMKLGGFHAQFNIIDPQLLIDAQKHPEKYPGLMVRVAAYVALWNQLSKKQQDEIIKRTLYML